MGGRQLTLGHDFNNKTYAPPPAVPGQPFLVRCPFRRFKGRRFTFAIQRFQQCASSSLAVEAKSPAAAGSCVPYACPAVPGDNTNTNHERK
jgi:hypothetical protein